MTKQFKVFANAADYGIVMANSEQEAKDLIAKDMGYKSEADMVEQIEKPSELVAVETA